MISGYLWLSLAISIMYQVEGCNKKQGRANYCYLKLFLLLIADANYIGAPKNIRFDYTKSSPHDFTIADNLKTDRYVWICLIWHCQILYISKIGTRNPLQGLL